MKKITEPLLGFRELKEIADAMAGACYPIAVAGCVDSQEAHLIAELGRNSSCRFVVAENELRARKIYEDLSFFDENTVLYPSRDLLFYSADVASNQISLRRIETLEKLAAGEEVTIVAVFDVLMEKMIPPAEFAAHSFTINMSSIVETAAIREKLAGMGYENTGLVEIPGQFGVRGGIIDIYPLTAENPVRIELWGDEIDSIRSFNPDTQRSIENLESVTVFPAKEVLLPKNRIGDVVRAMRDEYTVHKKEFFGNRQAREERSRLRSMVERTKDELMTFGSADASENLINYFYDEPVSLIDYLPSDTTFFVQDPGRVMEVGSSFEETFVTSMSNRLEGGYILPGQVELLFHFQEVYDRLCREKLFLLSALGSGLADWNPRVQTSLNTRSIPSYNNSFPQLVKDLKAWKKKGYRILLLSSSGTRAKRLAENIRYNDLFAHYSSELDGDLVPGQVLVSRGRLSAGFEYPDLKLVVLTEKDIFKQKKKKKRKRESEYNSEKIRTLAEISVGDYVVHENYGLGIYRGIEQVTSDEVTSDYIRIEYDKGDGLLIPADKLDRIGKYSNLSGKQPKLNRLGGNEWERTKNKVRTQVEIAAKELIDLYASRESGEGYACGPDTLWQTEFEERFPYEETEDQLIAIEDTKKDMESPRIMDRLICGDVGYGKTEIAIRAAFKEVQESRQVVYLVPTTILAQQHYNTFRERMEDYPVEIAVLSRFCTPKEVREITKGLKEGTIDIVIGTHKVLSKSIRFRKLGLLIIDEEQRFGVRQKEKIKQLKKEVDVLTLTATPIPRTLHMSLSGIRDMSVLEVPPVDRRAIQTYVMEYNEELVREAIIRELARGGQVYYVYNRVSNIESVSARIQELVPDAVVDFAHGRMGERQLENIMEAFIDREIDVLVSTTIIETGLDIPNVNTMIVEDANRFGLAQLYQLRGRVGRSNRTAYAFFMYKRNTILKEQAEKRLKAIREFTDLGSGFKIAMRDLEIRGAGNLLGAQQSGHMEEIGYDLYTKMLSDAMREQQGKEPLQKSEGTSVDIRIDAYIPADYISNESQKLSWYKRIASVRTLEEAEDMIDELNDRYGDLPQAMNRLFEVALLRERAREACILAIEQKGLKLRFVMQPDVDIYVEKVPAFMDQYRGRMRYEEETAGDLLKQMFVYEPERLRRSEVLTMAGNVVDEIRGIVRREGQSEETDEKM